MLLRSLTGWVFLALLAGCGPEGLGDDQWLLESDPLRARTTAWVRVHYPAGWGNSIGLRCGGGGHDWNKVLAATWSTDDVWKVSVKTTTAIDCKPVYNEKTWAKGPNFRVEPGKTLHLYPHFFRDHGTLEQIEGWYAWSLNNRRRIWVYRPPSYEENTRKRYPVVYMHDGQNLFHDSTAFNGVAWNAQVAMDQGVADGSVREAIIVGIDNTGDRISEYTPVADPRYGGGNGAAYVRFVGRELKREVDAKLRTRKEAANTAIIGSSLGGLISVHAGLTEGATFGLVGAMSPSTWWNSEWIVSSTRSSTATTLPRRLYLDSGDSGSSRDGVEATARLAEAWKKKPSVQVQHHVQQGGTHSEWYWRQRLPGAFRFLLGPR